MIRTNVHDPIQYASNLADTLMEQGHDVLVVVPNQLFVSMFSRAGMQGIPTKWMMRQFEGRRTYVRAATARHGLRAVCVSRLLLVFEIPETVEALATERTRGHIDPVIYKIRPYYQDWYRCRGETFSEKPV